MNVYGVAREVAALYGLALRPPDTSARGAGRAGGRGARRDDRGAGPVRPLLRAGAGREGRPLARVAARPARARGHPLDQQRRRPHELRDDRDGPAEPRLRPGARAGRAARRALVARGRARSRRSTATSGRCRPGWASSRARAASRRWRSPGSWAAPRARSSDDDARRGARGRLVGAARDPPRGAGARHAHRGLAPLRARRRHRRGARARSTGWRTSRQDRRGHRAARASSSARATSARARTRPAAAGARERAPGRRGAVAAAGANARGARVPRDRHRAPRPRRSCRPGACDVARRGGPRGGGRPPLRPRQDPPGAAARGPRRAACAGRSGASARSARS